MNDGEKRRLIGKPLTIVTGGGTGTTNDNLSSEEGTIVGVSFSSNFSDDEAANTTVSVSQDTKMPIKGVQLKTLQEINLGESNAKGVYWFSEDLYINPNSGFKIEVITGIAIGTSNPSLYITYHTQRTNC